MKNKAITIPRISYAIQNDEVLLEQWADHGELMKVNLHKIQIMNISEQSVHRIPGYIVHRFRSKLYTLELSVPD